MFIRDIFPFLMFSFADDNGIKYSNSFTNNIIPIKGFKSFYWNYIIPLNHTDSNILSNQYQFHKNQIMLY